MEERNSNQLKDFSYCLVGDLSLYLRVKVCFFQGSLTGAEPSLVISDPYLRLCPELSPSDTYVTLQLFADNKPLSMPMRTRYQSSQSWNEWLVIPVKYRDLPLSSALSFTVWAIHTTKKARPIGGSTVPLFEDSHVLKKGRHKLYLFPGVEGDGLVNTLTPCKLDDKSTPMDRLETLMRKYEQGDLPKSQWLDHLAFREIEKVNSKETMSSKNNYLYVEFPLFDFPVVSNEKQYSLPPSIFPRGETDSPGIYDPEMFRDNPVEDKHRRLVRSHRNGPLDRDLKPNAKLRDDLQRVLRYPPTQALSTEEKDLLWKFRFYLTKDKKALTKFLKCVAWSDPVEVKQATELLHGWVDIDIEDALELLGPAFEDTKVRHYAVMQLHKADDEELQVYLLQLVQALKFDGQLNRKAKLESPLAEFLIDRSIKNPLLGSSFHWYLMVECECKTYGKMYGKIAFHYMSTMTEMPDGANRRNVLKRQGELIAVLHKLSREVRNLREARTKKIEKLINFIADPKNGLLSFPPMPLPLDASVEITGIIPEKAGVFKSALAPLRLTFTCLDGSEYPVMFKTGDDLRQDQLVVQIITLMDKLLRKENLDLKLTPYKVLATGSDHGMVQFISSLPLATVLAEHNNNLITFLREQNPTGGSINTMGLPPQVMDTYIKSCAGYCVITYLLGVGDRHLDNLLLTGTGNLFHVDFGFILGRDPKPFPPPMKLCKEMVEAMGGATSPHYQKFQSYCFTAFNSLRKSASLILNLFSLMVNANIPDIAIEPDKAVMKVQEKFRLDLTEDEAMQYFQGLIQESVSALFPQVIERIHQWAQYWRQ
ncbi:kinase-like domain-containing protein [Polychytrium aggregatum]|uniref:kinase-like domain-containing protein n=1 Tax=Polychytrium aggregatum TaxID=110093 RepID=UPI0022FEA0C2|nr:kinase-like domain-containing protein [Polychytrium aggregatum]KAI9203886.1 kinase-like domain-containing protein [Polychytrium aggregatum]